jgi:hypothetical protein
VILSSPRRSVADPQITPGYTLRRTVPSEKGSRSPVELRSDGKLRDRALVPAARGVRGRSRRSVVASFGAGIRLAVVGMVAIATTAAAFTTPVIYAGISASGLD